MLAFAIRLIWLDVLLGAIIPRAEARRRATFGAAADDYARRVPALVPWFR